MPSTNDYDWLGHGIYFWEHNARRAFEFAKSVARHPHPSGQKIRKPAIIGAVIDLGYCLNLLDSLYIEMVHQAYKDMERSFELAGIQLPENSPSHVNDTDRVVRNLDCAVIQFLHRLRQENAESAFQTVRAAFVEGTPLYRNAGFSSGNHIQVCVRDHQCICGYFRPLDENGKPLKFR